MGPRAVGIRKTILRTRKAPTERPSSPANGRCSRCGGGFADFPAPAGCLERTEAICQDHALGSRVSLDELKVVAGSVGAPTSAALLADVTAQVVARYQRRRAAIFPSGSITS